MKNSNAWWRKTKPRSRNDSKLKKQPKNPQKYQKCSHDILFIYTHIDIPNMIKLIVKWRKAYKQHKKSVEKKSWMNDFKFKATKSETKTSNNNNQS